ncbi:uncharacterized protein LOC116300529 [Actinia tenebrosa]|uniref:Uncharacterized protein LOC116300529 n=1 Tax=Actinia tenebrosa TaxID=6105 RepID=A0A6P8IEH5_ACTTE|nr:uncharacterized protein LOC116300529 [Actinia tenebrosa]
MLPEFKHSKGKSQSSKKKIASSKALALDICICKSKAKNTDKLIECHNPVCKNGTFFHLACLSLKRMPNNANSTWLCPDCKKNQAQSNKKKGSGSVKFVKQIQGTNSSASDKQKPVGKLTQSEFDLIASPTGWLDCSVIQEAHVLLMKVNSSVSGFQRPTLAPVRQFSVVTGDFIQIVHLNNNHWACLTSIGRLPGYVNLLDSMTSPISQEIIEFTKNLLGPNFKNITHIPVQQQQNGSDCGVFAIAYATCLAYGKTPVVKFIIPRTRPHLLSCLKAGHLTLFPTT